MVLTALEKISFWAAIAPLTVIGLNNGAQARGVNAPSTLFNAIADRSLASANQSVNVQMGDAGNAPVAAADRAQPGSSPDLLTSTGGAFDSASGVGGSGLSAANMLTVVAEADYETVASPSLPSHAGGAAAFTPTNGKP